MKLGIKCFVTFIKIDTPYYTTLKQFKFWLFSFYSSTAKVHVNHEIIPKLWRFSHIDVDNIVDIRGIIGFHLWYSTTYISDRVSEFWYSSYFKRTNH